MGLSRVLAAAIMASLCIVAPGAQTKPAPPTFSVSGCVNQPGTLAWTSAVTVAKGIALAGGFANTGEGAPTMADVTIRRFVDGRYVSVMVKGDTPVLKDDEIVVAYPK